MQGCGHGPSRRSLPAAPVVNGLAIAFLCPAPAPADARSAAGGGQECQATQGGMKCHEREQQGEVRQSSHATTPQNSRPVIAAISVRMTKHAAT